MRFKNAQNAFEYLYDYISHNGIDIDGTKSIFNTGFYIENPMDNNIMTRFRNWKLDYAEYEWQWYLSKNRSVLDIKKKAKIWEKMHNGDNLVNSNYGYQWSRNGQLDYVINQLKNNKYSRRAVITIYDGKENLIYDKDTPCTLNISFCVIDEKLNMSVMMRSNDLWYGFCNDQYCFSKLMQYVSNKLELDIGWYFHFVTNLHLYNNKLCKNNG